MAGRGRPRKAETGDKDTKPEEAPENVNADAKKPRGRPKKAPTAVPPAAAATGEVPSAKKRGRPKTKPAAAADPAPKRPRGRPKKGGAAPVVVDSTKGVDGGDEDAAGEEAEEEEGGDDDEDDMEIEVKLDSAANGKRGGEEEGVIGDKEQVEKLDSGKKETKASKEAKYNAAVVQASNSSKPWAVLVHKAPESDWFAYDPDTMRKTVVAEDGQEVVKVISWNVAGLRSVLKRSVVKGKKGGKGAAETQPVESSEEKAKEEAMALEQIDDMEDPDIICLQETKIQDKDVDVVKEGLLPKYPHSFWTCSTVSLGYSGSALFSKVAPLQTTLGLPALENDTEGRVITAEFDKFFVVCAYVPNAGEGLKRLAYREEEWDVALGNHCKELGSTKPVVLAGDLNCAHKEIDIFNPQANLRSAGFTIEERQSFQNNYLERGLADTFRRQFPVGVGYTYWGYRRKCRPKNSGWRLDYILASDALVKKDFDSFTMPAVAGSDHCPLGLTFTV